MSTVYFEDIFVNFYFSIGSNLSDSKDSNASSSFYRLAVSNYAFTKKQAYLAIKILEKYKIQSAAAGYDYSSLLSTAIWKNKFRDIDLTKSVLLTTEGFETPTLIIKFPYSLKTEFDREFVGDYPWDRDLKSRIVDFYSIDLIKLSEFFLKHDFQIDNSFTDALALAENIWNNADSHIPYSKIQDNTIDICNATEHALEYFEKNKGETLNEQKFLAKTMGYPLKIDHTPVTAFEKVVSSSSNNFYINDLTDFFEILEKSKGKVAILLDRTTNVREWMENFLEKISKTSQYNKQIRICFRESEDSKRDFNTWIQEKGLGGKIADGEIYVFQHTIPKWLFSSENSVKIVLTNLMHPATSIKIQDWLQSNPCVLYSGLWEPSLTKGTVIEKL